MTSPQDRAGPRLPRPIAGVLALLVAYAAYQLGFSGGDDWVDEVRGPYRSGRTVTASDEGLEELESARAEMRSGWMLEAEGIVHRLLADDTDGKPHQRWILRLADGSTLLFAHNTALAPRVPLEVGDHVRFRGQYEWNAEGGVVHWTHHDPDGDRPGGWVEHGGERYR